MVNPRALPVIGIQQSHGEARRVAPRRWLAVLVVHTHLPVNGLVGGRRRPAVGDEHRLRRPHHAAIPQIRHPFSELLRGAGRADMPGGLQLTALGRIIHQFPAQSRCGHVETHRFAQMLATQIYRHHRQRGLHGEEQDAHTHKFFKHTHFHVLTPSLIPVRQQL